MLPIREISRSQSSRESWIMQRESIQRYRYSNLLVIRIASWKSLGSFSTGRLWQWLGNVVKVVLSGCVDPQQWLRVTHSRTSRFESRKHGSWLPSDGPTSTTRAGTWIVLLTSDKHPWWFSRQLLSHVEAISNLSSKVLEPRTRISIHFAAGSSTTVSKTFIDNIKTYNLTWFCCNSQKGPKKWPVINTTFPSFLLSITNTVISSRFLTHRSSNDLCFQRTEIITIV